MATGGAASDSIILEEEIDPNYVPSEEEVLEYAKWLGMDLQDDQVGGSLRLRLHRGRQGQERVGEV